MRTIGIHLAVLILALSSGCSQSSGAADSPQKKQAVTAVPVAKIAFLDKEQCCKCTRERTEKSWAALQVALDKKDIPVERLHTDSQEAQAEFYRKLKPYQVIPAIYFLDDQGKLTAMLQGEVGEDEIKKLLK